MAAADTASETTLSPLKHLTVQSAAFGLWEILIYAPEAQERPYVYQNKKKRLTTFVVCS